MRWRGKGVGFALVAILFLASVGVAGGEVVDMDFKDADIRDVLRVLAEIGRLNVLTDPNVSGSVTFNLRGVGVMEAIDLVVKASGYGHTIAGRTLIVGPASDLETRFADRRTVFFGLEYLTPQDIIPSLQMLLGSAEIQADPRNEGLIVRATVDRIETARAFIAERDVRPPLELEFESAPILSILRDLAREGRYNLIATPGIEGTLTIFLKGMDVAEAIQIVTAQAGLEYRIEGNNLLVTPGEPTARVAAAVVESDEIQIYRLYHIPADQARSAVGLVVSGNAILADEARNALIVRAPRTQLRMVESLLEQYDVPTVRVEGIIRQGESRTAILSIGGQSHVVRAGRHVEGLRVERIDDDSVTFVTAHGNELRVGTGGRE